MLASEEEMVKRIREVGLRVRYVPMVEIPFYNGENNQIVTSYQLEELHIVYSRIRRGILPI